MPDLDYRMKPTWESTSKDSKTLFYQGLPQTFYHMYLGGAAEGSGLSTGYKSAMVGMHPIDTTGYRAAHVQVYNHFDTIGHARMDTGYSSGISVGDFLWMRSSGRTSRRDLVRVLKVITDGIDGGSSNPTAETILILELQLDAMGWPNPQYNGYGHLTSGNNGGRGYRFDFDAWEHQGTIELVTENLASGGTAYTVAKLGRTLCREDSAGMGLGAAYSANERKWWLRQGYGSGKDRTIYVQSHFPAVTGDYGSGPLANVDRDGNEGVTYELNQPGNHIAADNNWSINYGEGYPRGEWGDNIRTLYREGKTRLPWVYFWKLQRQRRKRR